MNKKIMLILIFVIFADTITSSETKIALGFAAVGVFCLGIAGRKQCHINKYKAGLSVDWSQYDQIKKETDEQKKLKDLENFKKSVYPHRDNDPIEKDGIDKTIESLNKLKESYENYDQSQKYDPESDISYHFFSIKRAIERSRGDQMIALSFAVFFLIAPCKKLGENLKTYFQK